MIAISYIGPKKQRAGLPPYDMRLARGLVLMEIGAAMTGGKDQREDEECIRAAQNDPVRAAEAMARLKENQEDRERVLYLRASRVLEVLGATGDLLPPPPRRKSRISPEERLAKFEAAWPVLWRLVPRRHPYLEGVRQVVDLDQTRYNGVWVPEYRRVEAEGWEKLVELGFFDEMPAAHRTLQWNTRHAGQLFIWGSIKINGLSASAAEILMMADLKFDPLRKDRVEFVENGDEEGLFWVKPKAFGF